jgi:23S rRNA pseudouridine955/2504/2580 synthase
MTKQFEYLVVTEDESESRLDRIIRKRYPYLNQGTIEKSLRIKLIQVNGLKSTSNYRVKEADNIKISTNLLIEDYNADKPKKTISLEQVKLIRSCIIFQDEDLLVINKPAGLAVQGGSKIKTSIDDIMPSVIESFDTWSEEKIQHKLVHRLDKETSGILLIALNNKTAKELAHAFKNHFVEKKYLAILKGNVKSSSGEINQDINQEKAITNYKVLARKSGASFLEFRPITGKTHQLRIHSLKLGFPILGDVKYDQSIRAREKTNLHLHAAEITIPLGEKMLKFTAEPPVYFKKSLKEIFNL